MSSWCSYVFCTVFYSSLQDEKEIITQFELADAVYVKAAVAKPEKVLLWLGANVMLEYEYDEAHELLSKNFTVCVRNFT